MRNYVYLNVYVFEKLLTVYVYGKRLLRRLSPLKSYQNYAKHR